MSNHKVHQVVKKLIDLDFCNNCKEYVKAKFWWDKKVRRCGKCCRKLTEPEQPTDFKPHELFDYD